MPTQPRTRQQGPFRADQLGDDDRYELSRGHPIYCAPSRREHAGPNLIGAAVIETDPDVPWAGVDAGFAPDQGTLRAPDVAIGPAGDETGWIHGVPPLAVEYAGHGQAEQDLRDKIAELLSRGTQHIWVVRLVGPRRVEVYRPGEPMRVLGFAESLTAPGILRNPVPVAALFDREAAHEATLRNLLQRKGYPDLEQVLADSRAEGEALGEARGEAKGETRGQIRALREALLLVIDQRGLSIAPEQSSLITECSDPARLRDWLRLAVDADSTAEILGRGD
jgi:Uma2 family endonuclease